MATRPVGMEIRKLVPEDLEQFNELLRYAFQVTEADLARTGWQSSEIRQSKHPILENANVWGWFDSGRLASQIAVYPMKMNVHGAIREMGFVTGVATYPEYAGMGLMSELMRLVLNEMRAAGQSISLLFPYSIPLYRHRGWEIISDRMTYTLKDFQLPRNLAAPGIVRRVPDDDPSLVDLHDRFARKTHGCILRNPIAWGEYWRWEVEDVTVAMYYDANGVPQGYLVYYISNEVFNVKEMVCMDQEAWDGLWSYVAAHESMVGEVVGNNYSNTPIAFWLEDGDIEETIRPYMMARVVDVARFLGKYRFDPTGSAERLSFDVSDKTLTANGRRFTIAVGEDGLVRSVEEGRATEYCTALSIGTLSALLMGYKRPAYLREIGRLETDGATMDLLERLVPEEKAYISDYM